MIIAGLVKSSLIDYPNKVAAVVFTQGCNLRCAFCHNPDLIPIKPSVNSQMINESDFFDFLKTRTEILDGVVITGGEPLIQEDIEEFIAKIKLLGFAVKLDTNGSSPDKLARLISKKLVDYIAMDIKSTADKYPETCSYMNTKVIQESIKLIMNSGLDYEFRSTVLPMYHSVSDFKKIGEMINGATLYTIQGFRSQITYDPKLSGAKSFSNSELLEISKTIKPYVKKVIIHSNL